MALQNRVALVSGGGGEIGSGIARAFATKGASVIVCDINKAKADAVAESIAQNGGNALALALDVGDPNQCKQVADQAAAYFGSITTLVNAAAAVTPDGSAEALDLDAWEKALTINFTGVFLMCKYTMPHLRAAGGGSVINIASSFAHFGLPGRSAYCSTKAAVIHFTQVLAIDYGPHNVRANTISPGPIDTERSLRRYGTREQANKVRGRGQVLGRTGTVDEVAATACFLASDDSSFITGTDIRVDGGQTAFKGDSLGTSL